MTDDAFLRRLKWFGAGAANIVPGFSWFISLSPPLFPQIGIIASALGFAIIFTIYAYSPKPNAGRLPQLVKMGFACIIGALCLIIIYLLFLRCSTVLDPQSEEVRFQIGFGKQDWSLTEVGLEYKKKILPGESVVMWMQAEAAFFRQGPEKLWKPWSILLAGTLMIVIFVFAFGLWAAGFAFLAKQGGRGKFN